MTLTADRPAASSPPRSAAAPPAGEPVPTRPSLGGRLRRAAWGLRRTAARVVGTVRSRLRPVTGVITTLGRTALGAAAVLLLFAFWGGWVEFAVAGVALLVAVLAALLFSIGRSKYRVEIDLRTRRVVVGEPASGRILVSSTASRPMLASRLELPIGADVGRLAVPALQPGEQHEELFVVPTQRRAVITVGPARSVRGDAFGLVRREVRWTDPQLLYVHPRTTSLSGAVAGFFRDLEGQPSDDLATDDLSFHALRGYVPGDDRRNIHWRTSARSGALMVRQFVQTRRSHIAVALSTDAAEYADADEFELAIEAGASVVVQAAKEGRELTLITGPVSLPSGPVRRTLDQLAGVGLDTDAPRSAAAETGVAAAARRVVEVAPDVSIVFLLCGSTPTPAQIRRAGALLPLGVRVVAVRAVPGIAPTVRRISGVTVVTVGSLDKLPPTLRKVRG
ncbi:DUF58 domain-containing protein [Nakamurella sp.]|uniref:DUF58 domain-containing protein n=1 Tax=Nakamurella sp. TaxID=1869182 RepID=UPI003784EA41